MQPWFKKKNFKLFHIQESKVSLSQIHIPLEMLKMTTTKKNNLDICTFEKLVFVTPRKL